MTHTYTGNERNRPTCTNEKCKRLMQINVMKGGRIISWKCIFCKDVLIEASAIEVHQILK
jgi:hypothetical protein